MTWTGKTWGLLVRLPVVRRGDLPPPQWNLDQFSKRATWLVRYGAFYKLDKNGPELGAKEVTKRLPSLDNKGLVI